MRAVRRVRWPIVFAAFLWLAASPGLRPARADVQVNTYTTNAQERPSVAVDSDGDFVVVWQSYGSGGTDSAYVSIQGQRYASDGSAVGPEFQINTYTTNYQNSPSVAMDSDGDFVVVWASDGSGGTDSSYISVQGQRYTSDGSEVGVEFQVNTYTTYPQDSPSVAVDQDGDFVIVWQNGISATDPVASIRGQRYASDGSAVGVEFQVNTYTTNLQLNPSVGVDADGDFVVVWHSDGSSGTDSLSRSIQGQRYASDGMALGGQFQVNTYTTGFQAFPSVGVDADGDFVVAWMSDGSVGTDSSAYSIQGQRYASDGSTVGVQFQVNSYTSDGQIRPSVGVDSDGDFVVVWQSDGSRSTDTNGYSVQGQRYASDGSTVGGQFQVNTYTASNQQFSGVGVDSDGDFVVVWQSTGSGDTDSAGTSIQKSDPGLLPVELQSFTIE